MKRLNALFALIGTLAVALCCAVPATAVTITGTVVLDGVNNPFGNLTGSAATDDLTYTFTDGVNFDPGGKIEIWDHTNTFRINPPVPGDEPTTEPLKFVFAPGTGGLNMGADGYIDTMMGSRGGGNDLTFVMNNNNITGMGSINNCVTDGSCGGGGGGENSTGPPFGGTAGSMDVVIQSLANVTLKQIINGSQDAGGGSVNITAAGHVEIGKISTADPTGGGNAGKSIDVKAGSMKLDDLDSSAGRTGGQTSNGPINLTALAPPGYDIANAAGNTPANVIELTGLLDTRGAMVPDRVDTPDIDESLPENQHVGGHVNITAVKVIFGPEFVAEINPNQPAPGMEIHVGASDLFMDMAAGDFSATADVQFTRPIIPEPSTLILLVCGALGLAARRRVR